MEVFHHIRYATAGRFEPPVVSSCTEPENYSGQLTAFPQEQFRLNKVMGEGQPLCQSENAHYLSIYTPSRNGKFPVLFWIHGGAFIAGSGEDDTYDASALSEEGNIVVVTISYRLGILGYTYDETLPCQQMGTKDQIAAMHWVHKNIHLYGGDASRVTKAQTYFLSHNGSMMPFGPILLELSKPIQTPGVERVLFTWQKDDLSPFVELTLGGDTTQEEWQKLGRQLRAEWIDFMVS